LAVSQTSPVANNAPHSGQLPALPLAERLDSAIGEATTGMGALLTELIRRTLKGGVQKVDEELQVYVVEKVGQTIAERVPAIEESARNIAETRARETASELVSEGLGGLERKLVEATGAVGNNLVALERKSEAVTRELAEKITVVEEVTQRKVDEKIEDLVAKSRQTAASLKEHLQSIHSNLEENTAKLRGENQEHVRKQTEINEQLQLKAAEILNRLVHEESQRRTSEDQVKGELNRVVQEAHRQILELRSANQRLQDRLAEIEKPKGISAFVGKLFGRKS
jgi:hypothetical protein